MTSIEIKDVKGEAVGTAELSDAVFAIEPHMHVMHTVVRAQQASWRQGTHDTKTRGQVRGGGKKPWRQKGTGRARQGAMRSALSAKLADGQLVVVKDFAFEKPRTKDAVAFLKAFGLDGKRVTLVIGDEDVETFLSFRNLQRVSIVPVSCMNTYDFLDNKALVVTKQALEKIEEVLA